MNKCTILGRLCKDAELKYTPNGIATASFTLAVNRDYKNEQGQYDADFIPVVAWRGLAETLAKHVKKGARVAVNGRIQTRSYTGNDGQKRYVTEIIADGADIIDWDSAEQSGMSGGEISQGYSQELFDDDCPF